MPPVDLAVSITGIAGPGGGDARQAGRARAFRRRLAQRPADPPGAQFGDIGRSEVRRHSVLQALAMLRELAEKEEPRAPRNVK